MIGGGKAFRAALKTSFKETKGYNIFHSRQSALKVLQEMTKTPPATHWMHQAQIQDESDKNGVPSCGAEFVKQVYDIGAGKESVLVELGRTRKFPIIVVEGLDGVGKTTVTTHLSEKIGATLVRTPNPNLEHLRQNFRGLPEPLSRAFYCGANYLAAKEILEITQSRPVVVDRWWASTCAMSFAALYNSTVDLPADGHPVYKWPSDLPRPDAGFVLTVPEDIRRKRMDKRGDENEEEKILAAKENMRIVAMEAYSRMKAPLYEPVAVPNYCVAINTILDNFADVSSNHSSAMGPSFEAASPSHPILHAALSTEHRIAALGTPQYLGSLKYSQGDIDATPCY